MSNILDLPILEVEFINRIRDYLLLSPIININFSGGKDSTVLLFFIKKYFPNTPRKIIIAPEFFYPEVAKHIKKTIRNEPNVEGIKTNYTLNKVIEEYGGFGKSKKVMNGLSIYNNYVKSGFNMEKYKKINNIIRLLTIFKCEHIMNDIRNNTLPHKLNLTSKYSCCNLIKKQGFKSKDWTINGLRSAERGRERVLCINKTKKYFSPLSKGDNEDMEEAIKKYNIEIASCYNFVNRTGCLYCPFAGKKNRKLGKEKYPNLETYDEMYNYFNK